MGEGLEFFRARLESARVEPGGSVTATVPVEVRKDPITGATVHLAHFGAIEPVPLDTARYGQEAVRGYCPFCGPERERVTPRFPPELIPEGRLARGEALLVPNLFPYDVHSTVCILTREHVVPIQTLTETQLADGFSLGVEAWRRLAARDRSCRYPVMGWNAMPPSGGGLVHPHQQYLLTAHPGNRYLAERAASEAYAGRHATPIWTALVEEERRLGERFLGTTGPWSWLAAFAPRGVFGEVLAVHQGPAGLAGLDEESIRHLVTGLRRILSGLAANGIGAFNASLFVAAPGEDHFLTHLAIVPRTFLNLRDMAPDVNFLQTLLGEPIAVVLPETLAASLRPLF